MPWRVVDVPDEEREVFQRQFRKRARFLVDESLGIDVALTLRRSGWSAVFVSELGLAGHDDTDVFSYAHREERILLTHDRDFLDDRRFPEHRNPGVVVLPGGSGDSQQLVEALRWVLALMGNGAELWSKTKIVMSHDGSCVLRFRQRDTGAVVSQRYCLKGGETLLWVDETAGE